MKTTILSGWRGRRSRGRRWRCWRCSPAAAAAAAATRRVTVQGDVPIAYVKRSTAMSMNPTDGTPSAPGRRPDDPREVVAERARAQHHRAVHAGRGRRVRPRGLVRRQEDRLRDALPDVQHVDDRRPAGLHRPLEHLGIRHDQRRLHRRHVPAPDQLDRRRRRRPGLPAGRPRLRVRVEPPDQDRRRCRAARPSSRSTSTSASACSTCTRWTPTAATSRRSRSTRATTATRWCARTATSCSRAGSTSASATASRSSASSPTAPTCSCSTARRARATASCTRATWIRTGKYKGFLSSSLMSLSGTQEGGALMFIDAANYSENNTPANTTVAAAGGQTRGHRARR